jgi:Bacterial SH3 domain
MPAPVRRVSRRSTPRARSLLRLSLLVVAGGWGLWAACTGLGSRGHAATARSGGTTLVPDVTPSASRPPRAPAGHDARRSVPRAGSLLGLMLLLIVAGAWGRWATSAALRSQSNATAAASDGAAPIPSLTPSASPRPIALASPAATKASARSAEEPRLPAAGREASRAGAEAAEGPGPEAPSALAESPDTDQPRPETVAPPPAPEPSKPLLVPPRLVVIAVPGANLRAEPGTTSPIITTVPYGTVVEALPGDAAALGEGWQQVLWNDHAGWLLASLLGTAP